MSEADPKDPPEPLRKIVRALARAAAIDEYTKWQSARRAAAEAFATEGTDIEASEPGSLGKSSPDAGNYPRNAL
jgi:hypothetical protein